MKKIKKNTLLAKQIKALYVLNFFALLFYLTSITTVADPILTNQEIDKYTQLSDSLKQSIIIKDSINQKSLIENKSKKNLHKNEINHLTVTKKLININTASKDELCELKGIGLITAEKIITFRNEQGLFSTINDLTKVKGIGSKKLMNIKNRIIIK